MAFYYTMVNNICLYSGASFEGSIEKTTLVDLFRNNKEIVGIRPIDNYVPVEGITNANDAFGGCSNLEFADFSGFGEGSKIGMANIIFSNCGKLTNVKWFYANSLNEFYPPFRDCGSNDIELLFTCHGGDLTNYFRNTRYKKITVETYNNEAVTGIRDIFNYNIYLETIDMSSVVVNNPDNQVYISTYAFANCWVLQLLKLPKIIGELSQRSESDATIENSGNDTLELIVTGDLSQLTKFDGLFGKSNYKAINLSKVVYPENGFQSIRRMFTGNRNLTTIYSESINVHTLDNDVFENCSEKLIGGNGTVWNSGNTSALYARIDTPNNPGYFTKPKFVSGLNVTLDNPNAGDYEITRISDTTYKVAFIPAVGYKMLSMVFDPKGREEKFYRENPALITLPQPQEYNLVINTVSTEQSKNEYNKGNYLQGLEEGSDKIDLDKANGWLNRDSSDLYTIWLPNNEVIKKLSTYIYGTGLTTALQKALQNIVGFNTKLGDYILSFKSLPVAIPADGTKNMKMGWLDVNVPILGSGDTVALASQYTTKNAITVDCGVLRFDPVYNNHLDYECTIRLYLPYIGYQTLTPYDVIGNNLHIIYTIDLLTGSCVAAVLVNDSVRYQFTGDCGYIMSLSEDANGNIPLRGVASALSMVGSDLGVQASGVSSTSERMNLQFKANALNTIGSMVNSEQGVSRGGAITGNTGCMGSQTPYLLIEYPRLSLPSNYGHLNGYPSNITETLSNLTGYTEVGEIHLKDIPCTDDELAKIEELLKTGVYL